MIVQEFEFDYDEKEDNLFLYKKGSKSKGGIELGNFIFDFNHENKIVGVEFLNANEALKDLINHPRISKKLLKNIKSCRISTKVINNLLIVKTFFVFKTGKQEVMAPLQVPRINKNKAAAC